MSDKQDAFVAWMDKAGAREVPITWLLPGRTIPLWALPTIQEPVEPMHTMWQLASFMESLRASTFRAMEREEHDMTIESFEVQTTATEAYSAPSDEFQADIERCMRGMKECAWEYSGVSGLPIPKRGEVKWLDECMKRACE